MYGKLQDTLAGAGIAVKAHAKLGDYSFYRAGGEAALLCHAKTAKQAEECYIQIKDSGVPFFVMGNATNVLISDKGFDGVVLKFSGGSDIAFEQDALVCGGGVWAAKACATAMYRRLGGGEFLGTIPGTLGGLTVTNAGCFGREIKDITTRVRGYMDGQPFTLCQSECGFCYRDSVFSRSKDCIILEVTLQFAPSTLEQILQKTRDIRERRRQSQPLSLPSLGSTFKRTPSHAAAYLIDRAGLKGTHIGGAKVSEKHAGFIVNTGSATAADTAKLIRLIKQRVYQEFGETLQEEIVYLGDFSDI